MSGERAQLASPVRLLYVPNEDGDFRQTGIRRPLADLGNAGLISDVSVYSLQLRVRRGGDAEAHRRGLISRVENFQPDIVFMQHAGGTGLTDEHFRQMRRAASFELIYHEGDPFSRWLHPLPPAARAAGRAADVVFTVGAGTFTDNFARAGASDIRWAPSAFDAERYPVIDVRDKAMAERQFDVVIVANRNRPRIRGLPNWRDRIKFVEAMQARFGERLAIFGRGWEGPGVRGPVAFGEQTRAIQSGWVSANWDHFAMEPKYFSNRLPISLSAGSVHATTSHPGYSEIFAADTQAFLQTARDGDELVDKIARYLSGTTHDERVDAGVAAARYAHAHFRQDDQLVQFLNYSGERVSPTRSQQAWAMTGEVLEEI